MKKLFTCLAIAVSMCLAARSQTNYLTAFKTDAEGGLSITVQSGGKLFFSAPDSSHGRELWCTDGTPEGTYLVKDIYPGIASSVTVNFSLSAYDLNGILYFKANNGVTGPELWRSDGTEAGTWLVSNLYIDQADHGIGEFTSIGNILYFTANGNTLWRSDGTAAGTYSLRNFSIIRSLTAFKNNLYFSAAVDNSGEELWRSNGTAAGTFLLKDLNGAFGASLPINFHATSNALYFMALTDAGWELWKTTGTAASTVMVKDINPGGGSGVLSVYSEATITSIGNTIYFRATDGATGFQLWKSDGTDAGTVRLSSLADGVDQYCNFPVVNGKVLFNSYAGPYYWQYNPATDAVTPTAYPYFSYFINNNRRSNTFLGSYLFYAGQDSVYGAEMWQSHGVAGSTRKIQETHLVDNWNSSNINGFNTVFGKLGSKLLFAQARRPFDTQTPVFTYDTALATSTAFAPSVIVPVPLPSNKMHLVWNRIENAAKYEIRYAPRANSPLWLRKTTTNSYVEFANLLPKVEYVFQVRAFCNNQWTSWSNKVMYKTNNTYHDYNLNILADRAENATTMRLYWLKTPEITRMQLRYRPARTTAWTTVQNATGYIRLTGLSASTLYEYQYRPYFGGWGDWYPSLLYFATPQASAARMLIANTNKAPDVKWRVSPNPAADKLYLSGTIPAQASYTITNVNGVVLKTGVLASNTIDINNIHSGLLMLTIQKGTFLQTVKFVKQ